MVGINDIAQRRIVGYVYFVRGGIFNIIVWVFKNFHVTSMLLIILLVK